MFINAVINLIISVPFIIIYHIFFLQKHRNPTEVIPHIIIAYVFSFIIAFIFSATEIPDISTFGFAYIKARLIPFVIESRKEFVLNILLFIPFGFVVPLLWKRFQNIIRLFFFGLFFSLFIELSQLFNHRVTDIDDLITNTAGALIGYLMFMFIRLFIPKSGTAFVVKKKSEVYVYIGIVFVAYVFVKPLAVRIIS